MCIRDSTRHMVKIRSTPLKDEQSVQSQHCAVENNHTKFHIPPRFDGNRNVLTDHPTKHCIQNSEQSSLPTLNLPDSEYSDSDFSETREESQPVEPLYTNDSTLEQTVNKAPDAPNAPTHQRKSARENFGKLSNKYNDFYM